MKKHLKRLLVGSKKLGKDILETVIMIGFLLLCLSPLIAALEYRSPVPLLIYTPFAVYAAYKLGEEQENLEALRAASKIKTKKGKKNGKKV